LEKKIQDSCGLTLHAILISTLNGNKQLHNPDKKHRTLGGREGRFGYGEEINHAFNRVRTPVVTLVVCHFTHLVNPFRHFTAGEFSCCEFTFVVKLSLGGEERAKVPKNLVKFKSVELHYNIKYTCKIIQY
jgi:hypothetical protein